MREIKFRAWDSEIGAMVTPKLFENLLDGKEVMSLPKLAEAMTFADIKKTVAYRRLNGNPFKISNLIIMQFTGLLDKNGKEIWEKDVARLHNGEIGTVIYNMPDGHNNIYGFIIKTKNNNWGFDTMTVDCEVIGNVFQNPELLKGESR